MIGTWRVGLVPQGRDGPFSCAQQRIPNDACEKGNPRDMRRKDLLGWLIGEVRDLLDVSSVGLYELPQILEGSPVPLDRAARIAVAKEAVEALISDGGATLVCLNWPSDRPIRRGLDLRDFGSEVWQLQEGNSHHVALLPDDDG